MGRPKFADGFILGAIAGVILGVLFAPESGDKTREKLRKLKEENEDLIQQTKEKSEQMVNKTLHAIEKGFDKIGKMINENRNGNDREETEVEAG